jgi:hypothetical protein
VKDIPSIGHHFHLFNDMNSVRDWMDRQENFLKLEVTVLMSHVKLELQLTHELLD